MSVCYDLIRGAYGEGGDQLTEVEIAALQKTIARRVRENKARTPGLSDDDALVAAGKELAEQAERAALVKKRNEFLGLKSYLEATARIENQFGDDPTRGLKAWIVGVQSGEIGARKSAAGEIEALERHYFSGVMASVAKVEGGLDLFAKGALDRDVARALWALDAGGDISKMDVRAVGIAKAIRDWQNVSKNDANKAGAWIGKDENYVTKQSHDSLRISRDRDGWMAMMMAKADIPRMMAETDADSVEELLGSIWNALSSGVHLKSVDMSADAARPGLKGMAKSISQDRVIHFKSADDWMDYNDAFGGGNLREAILGSFKNLARATGLMRVMGPNHESTYQRVVDSILAKLQKSDPVAAGKFQSEAKSFKNRYLAEIDGSLDVPGSNTLAQWGAGIRAVQNMASLGGSVLASVGDLGVMMVGAKHHGANGFEMVGNTIKNMFSGRPNAEKLELYADLGLALESMLGKFATSRFSVDDGVRGAVGQMQKTFFTMNLQNRWTDSGRMAIAEFISMNLARKSKLAFDGLDPDIRRTMTLYGIDAGKWDIIRSGTLRELDGKEFLTPNALRDVPDDKLAAYLASQNKKSGPAAIREFRGDLEREVRNFFVDQNGYMMLMPDAATRGIMKGGTQKGTVWGEVVRMVMQFKSFPMAYSQRVLGREMKQNGVAGVARLVFFSTIAGYAAMTLKDLAKGKTPRNYTDIKTWEAAFLQGGGAGIYGDLLFSQVVDRPYDAAGALFGPTFSDVFGPQGLAGISNRVLTGEDPSAAALRLVQSNTPFANLFYTKLALDYFIFWNAQEFVNPGSLARMEREMEKRTGQQMMISPSRDRFQPE